MLIWWSIAYVMIFASLISVYNYGSSIWYDINSTTIYNGYVESISRLFAAFCSTLPALLEQHIVND